ncbi:MAG: lipoprotein signal peptidase [Campylobacterales bacterium]|nr:lipoprotein signal peptidase [Campylobacterales bacterium]
MIKKFAIFFGVVTVLIAIDQAIKQFILNGFRWDSECISIVLAFNKGVAFSMFAFLDEYLKFIQLLLIAGLFIYLVIKREIFENFYIAFMPIFAGGISNIYDRFIHEGVVDYVYWHCYFDFAIFNFADVLIDIGVGLILIKYYKAQKSINHEAKSV